MVTVTRGMFGAAVLDRLIARTPFVRISMPRADQERVIPLTIEQVRLLADTVKPKYRAMVLAQAGLGLRVGELLALRVEDVNFRARTIRVEHQIDKVTRERVAPKTPKSRRTLPLPDMVSMALAEHIRLHPPAADGLPSSSRNTSTAPTRKVTARTASRGRVGKSATRHHFASMLLAAGESVVAVAERLGHEDGTWC
jgi:integrase